MAKEVVIRRGDKPVARLVAVVAEPIRRFGADAGVFVVPDDFDEPLTDAVLADFE